MKTRRQFIKQFSLGVGAASLLPQFTEGMPFLGSPYQEQDKKLKVALMGLGNYAGRVAEAMKDCKLAVLTGIVTGTPSKIDTWKSKYNIADKNVYNYDNLQQIASNKDIDVVYVTTPNSLHHKHVLQVAAAGKHVICEKPIADNAKQAKEMVEACNKAGVKLYVGYRLHFEPFNREVVRMRESGELGKIVHVNNFMGFKIGDPTQWRLKKALAGGGAMMDVGIYALNAARYCTGEEPIWVTAQESKTDKVKFAEVDETVMFQLGFPSGVVASCGTTYNFNSPERLFVAGEKGFVELSPAFGYGPIKGRTNRGPINLPHIAHQTLQMDGIADCILNGKPDPNVTGAEGVKDMVVIDAVYESIRKGGQKIVIGG